MFSRIRAFSGFSVDDVGPARRFYGETLGVPLTEDNGMLFLQLPGGGEVLIYPKGDGHQPASFTVLNFPVRSVDDAVARLNQAGVELLRYDGMPHEDNGIVRGGENGPTIGWFADPAGNVLSVLEDDSAAELG